MNTFYGVYRARDGKYLARSATTNRKLAEEIAAGLTRGEVIRLDGSLKQVDPVPHVVREIGEAQS